MVLLRWGVGAIGAGSAPGGAAGGACFGVLRLGEGQVDVSHESPKVCRRSDVSHESPNKLELVKSSQLNTLPIAKSQTRSKQNKDMHKCSRVYSERGVFLPVFDIGRRMGLCPGMQNATRVPPSLCNVTQTSDPANPPPCAS